MHGSIRERGEKSIMSVLFFFFSSEIKMHGIILCYIFVHILSVYVSTGSHYLLKIAERMKKKIYSTICFVFKNFSTGRTAGSEERMW